MIKKRNTYQKFILTYDILIWLAIALFLMMMLSIVDRIFKIKKSSFSANPVSIFDFLKKNTLFFFASTTQMILAALWQYLRSFLYSPNSPSKWNIRDSVTICLILYTLSEEMRVGACKCPSVYLMTLADEKKASISL